MCLERIDQVTDSTLIIGWKIFRKYLKGNLQSMFFAPGHNHFYQFPSQGWIADNNIDDFIRVPFFPHYYSSGFHYFTSYKDACTFGGINPTEGESFRYIVKKIIVKKVVASGKQEGLRVGVAKEIFIV